MIAILLSTYNGERYLVELLESVIAQQDVDIKIFVRDDGSTDRTQEILSRYAEKGALKWYQGQKRGPAKSFLDLVARAPTSEYYAFCDQDDIWDKCKLKKAINQLSAFDNKKPNMYYSAVRLVNESLELIEEPKRGFRPNTFPMALLRNNVIGCTVVFNRALACILQTRIPAVLIMHDSWAYKACLGCGGTAVYDETPYISYRQHSENAIGGRSSFFKKLQRSGLFSRGNIRLKTAKELEAIFCDYLTDENKKTLDMFTNYQRSLKSKAQILTNKDFRSGVITSDLSFFFCVIFNKL